MSVIADKAQNVSPFPPGEQVELVETTTTNSSTLNAESPKTAAGTNLTTITEVPAKTALEKPKRSLFQRFVRRRTDRTTPCPNRQDSGFFSRWTFTYMDEMVSRGIRRDLQPEDFPRVEDDDEARALSTRLLEEWEKEVKQHGEGAKLWRATWRVFGWKFMFAGIWYFTESLVKIAEGVTLGYLLQWFQKENREAREGYLCAMGLAIASGLHAGMHHVVFLVGMRLGMQMRVAFIATIYRKCLALSLSNTSSTGLIVNLVSNDVQRFEDMAPFINFGWLAPIELLLALYFMYLQISWAAFAAVGALLLVIPMQGAFASRFAKLRKKTVAFRDDRIKSISDMLAGIMVVKLYAWESPFVKKINELRNREMRYIKHASTLRALNEALYFASSGITSLFGFVTYYLIGGILTPSKVFTCLTYLTSVRLTVTNFFPKAIQFGAESWVSLRRIEAFLSLPEIGSQYTSDPSALSDPNVLLAIKNGTFTWGKGVKSFENKHVVHQTLQEAEENMPREILKNVNIEIRKAELVGIIGPVGAGKSSLLNALLGEMDRTAGSLVHRPDLKVAYVPQQPYIVAGSIKENILFGHSYDAAWFQQVISCCAMERDVQQWDKGVETIVGERGVLLSGGQRARLGLARALYHRPEVLFLDDPLSALDPKVAKTVFQNIKGVFSDCAVVLVTHQLQFVGDCDQIVLVEDGVITRGTVQEIVNSKGSAFAGALKDFISRPAGMDVTVDDAVEDNVEDTKPQAKMEKKVLSDDASDDTSTSKDLTKEAVISGSISLSTYYRYFSAGAGILSTVILLVALFLGEGAMDVSNWWLAHWSQSESEEKQKAKNSYVFLGLVLGTVAISIGRAILFFWVSWKSGKVLFERMTGRIFAAPMSFFHANPHGRLMNRFSKDISLVDELLPQTFFDFIQCAFMIMGTLVIAVSIIPYILILLPFVAIAFYFLRTAYISTSRQIKRIEAVTRSPVYGSVGTLLEGLGVVRAFNAGNRFVETFVRTQNENTRIYFAFIGCARWLGFRLDVGSAGFLAVVAFACVGLRDSLGLKSGVVGLVLAYVLQLTGLLQWAVRQSAEVENLMVSVERVVEYTGIEPEESEDDIKRAKGRALPDTWPANGEVKLSNMSLTYPTAPRPVLRNITTTIPAGTKLGIVGRTGAGKSSFLQALFRLTKPSPISSISIDNIPTSEIRLQDLRSRISIIPQEPFCFKGTLRFNVDPWGRYADDEIWRVLDRVELKARVSAIAQGLECEVTENGKNWSEGERQLICLARCILRDTKLIVMDEATSNVDLHTDALIQGAVRGGLFKDSTVLTIAHRLNTVIDYDLIMVLDDGQLVELGSPYFLLQKDTNDTGSWFARMVGEMGEEPAAMLKGLAWEREKERRANAERKQGAQQNANDNEVKIAMVD